MSVNAKLTTAPQTNQSLVGLRLWFDDIFHANLNWGRCAEGSNSKAIEVGNLIQIFTLRLIRLCFRSCPPDKHTLSTTWNAVEAGIDWLRKGVKVAASEILHVGLRTFQFGIFTRDRFTRALIPVFLSAKYFLLSGHSAAMQHCVILFLAQQILNSYLVDYQGIIWW